MANTKTKRIYEVAKDLKISSNALIKILHELGHEPKSHMSVATPKMMADIFKKFEAEKEAVKEKEAEKKEKKRQVRPIQAEKPAAEKAARPQVKPMPAGQPAVVPEHEKAKVHGKGDKRRRRDRKKKKEARKVDHKAVVKSFKATMASMDGAKRTRKHRRRLREDGTPEVDEGNFIEVNEFMTVAELAGQMNMKPAELIAKCFELGMMASINQRLDMDTIETLALECGFDTKVADEIGEEARDEEVEENLQLRAPVVTVMGHVDHGKTSLLDYIRKTDVASGEAGAITQHIGAYAVTTPSGRITFIDTPGHEAFTAMRARGAQVTDMVILVVAADDGVMPQTVEAVDHARAADVPIIVAINKIDKPGANPDRVKQQLSKMNLMSEDWGGKTIMIEVSAKTGQGVEQLLEMILLQAEMLNLQADPDIRGQGTVIEANLEKGRGPLCTVIIQKGSVAVGDPMVAGPYSGRVRAMLTERDQEISEAGPSTPVRITGLAGVPQAGDTFMVVSGDQEARYISTKRMQVKREHDIRRAATPATLENIYEQIKEGQIKELRLIIKADVDGSAEVLSETLSKIATDEVRTVVLHKGVGGITESDVLLAATSGAIIIGFNVRPDSRARETANREKVDIRLYSIIYDVDEDIRKALEGMLAPDVKEKVQGMAEIRQTFKVPKIGTIAGCFVKEGTIHRTDKAHVIRDGRVVHTGSLCSLKRFKDDAREVSSGFECGIGIENYNDLKVGDLIESFTMVEQARKLEQVQKQG